MVKWLKICCGDKAEEFSEMIIPAVSLWMEPWSPHLVHSSCQISLGTRFFLILECEWWFHPQEPAVQLPIPGELVCQVSLLNLNNPSARSELRYQNSFMWKNKQELDVELLTSNFPFTSLHPHDARYALSSLIWFKLKPMLASKAPINDGFTPSTLHNGYVWLSLCLQAEVWQFTAGADAILPLFSCLSVTPDPPWADPWPPMHHGPSFPLQGPRPELQDRRKWSTISGQTFLSRHDLNSNHYTEIKSMWQTYFRKSFRGQMCNWIWSPLDWEQSDCLQLGVNIDHPRCDWGFVMSTQSTQSSQPEKLHLLRGLIPSHAFGMTFTINAWCRQTGYTAVFWTVSGLVTIDIIHPRLKPARRCLSPVGFSWVLLQVLLCVKQNKVAVTLSCLLEHRCQEQTPH